MSLRTPSASSRLYAFSGSIFPAAVAYRLLALLLTTVAITLLLDDVDAHAAGGAFDDPHRGVDRVRVEIDQLRLGDLLHLRARDLADLVLVRDGRGLRDARGALEQHGRRRRLHDEGERAVREDRHDDREDQALLVSRLRVEALAELHD